MTPFPKSVSERTGLWRLISIQDRCRMCVQLQSSVSPASRGRVSSALRLISSLGLTAVVFREQTVISGPFVATDPPPSVHGGFTSCRSRALNFKPFFFKCLRGLYESSSRADTKKQTVGNSYQLRRRAAAAHVHPSDNTI